MLSLTYWPMVRRWDGPQGSWSFALVLYRKSGRASVSPRSNRSTRSVSSSGFSSPSPYRTTPFCSVFGTCGGCQLQHLSYPAQLAWKTDTVRGALQRIGGFHDAGVRDAVGHDPSARLSQQDVAGGRASRRNADHRFLQAALARGRTDRLMPDRYAAVGRLDRAPQSGTDPAGGQRSARGHTARRRA